MRRLRKGAACCVEQRVTMVKNNNTKLRSRPAFTRGFSTGYQAIHAYNFYMFDLAPGEQTVRTQKDVASSKPEARGYSAAVTTFSDAFQLAHHCYRNPSTYRSRELHVRDSRCRSVLLLHCLRCIILSSVACLWSTLRSLRT